MLKKSNPARGRDAQGLVLTKRDENGLLRFANRMTNKNGGSGDENIMMESAEGTLTGVCQLACQTCGTFDSLKTCPCSARLETIRSL